MSRAAAEYWRSGAGLGNITPHDKAWPEGEDFGAALSTLIGGESVLEFGCGIGRLAKLFAAQSYIGIDICAEAIEIARANLPHHRFSVIDEKSSLPVCDVTLLHTVLLHIPDGELNAIVNRLTSRRVIVSEVMGRHWRRDGELPVFNREADEYTMAFASRYDLARITRLRYPHYENTDLTIMEFDKISA